MGKSLYAAGTASPKGFDVATEGRRVVKDAAALAGATIKGDMHALANLRAEHAVDRRMSSSTWTDPNKKTGLESGMRSLGLVLDREKELQGPTGWTTDDLRRKYRDEQERTAAFHAGQEAKEEAERMEREHNVIQAYVTVPPHPLHMYYEHMMTFENERSSGRARARNKMKTFSMDSTIP